MVVQLYSPQGEKIYPNVKASNVYVTNIILNGSSGNNSGGGSSGGSTGGSSSSGLEEELDLQSEFDRIRKKLNEVSNDVNTLKNAQTLDFELNFTVSNKYRATNSPEKPADELFSSESYVMPNEETPYIWKQTIYKLNNGGELKTRELVTAALYPETQFLFAVSNGTLGVEGPNEKEMIGNVTSVSDKSNPKVRWYTTPRSVDAGAPYAWIAVRHKQANQTWGTGDQAIPFSYGMYGNYAFNTINAIKYCVIGADTNDSVFEKDGGYSPNDSLEHWVDSVDYDNLPTGLNKIYITNGTLVNNHLQNVYEVNGYEGLQQWSKPSLISVINK